MKYRGFLYGGKVLDRIDTTFGDEFGVTDSVALADVATALGVQVALLSAFHDDDRPQPEALIPIAIGPQAPVDQALGTLRTLLSKQDADITAGEVKSIVLSVARRLLERGRLN